MNRAGSIFAQVLQFIPPAEFAAAVRQHRAGRHGRGFNCWTQLVAMLFCQLGRAQSLRETVGGLAACEGKLRYLGVSLAPKRPTSAYANEHRPWELFQSVFTALHQRCVADARQQRRRKFRFKHKLLSPDATMIPPCLSLFSWAHYRRSKGAVKLHLVLGHDGYLPRFAVVTEGIRRRVRGCRTRPGALPRVELPAAGGPHGGGVAGWGPHEARLVSLEHPAFRCR